jgi:hypothetical protein
MFHLEGLKVSDIVERLLSFRPTYGWPEEYATVTKPTIAEEAADEVERLRAERDEARFELSESVSAIAYLNVSAERDRLRDALTGLLNSDMVRREQGEVGVVPEIEAALAALKGDTPVAAQECCGRPIYSNGEMVCCGEPISTAALKGDIQ